MLLYFVSGCGDPGDSGEWDKGTRELVERHRGAMEAHLRRIDEFAAKVAWKRVSAARLELPPGVKLKSTKTSVSGNALVVHLNDVRKERSLGLVRADDGLVLINARQLLDGSTKTPAQVAEGQIQDLLAVRYLGIIQELRSSMAKVGPDGETFSAGAAEFRIHFYDLVDQKELGGIDCRAETSKTVSIRKGWTSNSVFSALESDLKENAGKVMEAALRPYRAE